MRTASAGSLAWTIRPDRGEPATPLIKDLDALPIPRHDLLPLNQYRAPLVDGPYSFVVTSRGCPGDCRFCIKHVSYGRSVRYRSPEHVLAEIEMLAELGLHSVHMYADLFTVNRQHVMGICQGCSIGASRSAGPVTAEWTLWTPRCWSSCTAVGAG